MSEHLSFVYREEYWFISAFLNSKKVSGKETAKNLEDFIRHKFENLTPKDFYRRLTVELKEIILDMVQNISIECSWVPYLESFPYRDENTDREFDTLGFFQFKVEHYPNQPLKKENLKPMLIQQIPYLFVKDLKEFFKESIYTGILIDIESPVYVFLTSNNTKPSVIEWTQENIEKYKKLIGYWTEIYSGQWEDYSEILYTKRIENNLSNRLSELHFIRRNSGFVYMKEDSYDRFFAYMMKYVISPTPKMRAVLFALRSISESLDLLFLKTQSEMFQYLKSIEMKIKNLRLLRGLIQTNLSTIYNELDYNRRQHYTSVLKHLLAEFEIESIVKRVNEKFTTIYDAMQDLYHKKSEEAQEKTERGLNLLNLLFGAGVLADLAGVIMLSLNLQKGTLFTSILYGLIGIVIIGILSLTIFYYIYMRIQLRKPDIALTVDAIIEDQKGNVVLIKRKYPPFRDYFALPGGFIKKGEKPTEAVIREVKEETNLDIKIQSKLGVYNKEGRDPRGNVHTTAYICRIIGDVSEMRGGDDSKKAELIPLDQLKTIELAFDHKKILSDANLIK
ncbi:MAG: NUDIX hydrolase [Candidatus Bathyarchaeota archaeon]|nr:NUDIX hydrolase [Candidatus Bathyarchaeota archaeon]